MRDTDEVDTAFFFILASLFVSLSQKRVSSSSKMMYVHHGKAKRKKKGEKNTFSLLYV
jgi:hypothetical protein